MAFIFDQLTLATSSIADECILVVGGVASWMGRPTAKATGCGTSCVSSPRSVSTCELVHVVASLICLVLAVDGLVQRLRHLQRAIALTALSTSTSSVPLRVSWRRRGGGACSPEGFERENCINLGSDARVEGRTAWGECRSAGGRTRAWAAIRPRYAVIDHTHGILRATSSPVSIARPWEASSDGRTCRAERRSI